MLPKEVAELIGQSLGTRIFEVEKGAIKKFADAVDDRNPLYWDEEYARSSQYGSIIAPPGFFGWPIRWVRGSTFTMAPSSDKPAGAVVDSRAVLVEAGYSRVLDGGIDYEFFNPIRAGDTLTAASKIESVVEREGRSGKLIFVYTETTYTNQNGELVAKALGSSIHR